MSDQKLHVDLRGGDAGWVWAAQARVNFDVRYSDFTSWQAFRKFAFDPEFGIERKQDVFVPSRMEVPIFWPHAALRVLGFDLAIGICIRPPILKTLDA